VRRAPHGRYDKREAQSARGECQGGAGARRGAPQRVPPLQANSLRSIWPVQYSWHCTGRLQTFQLGTGGTQRPGRSGFFETVRIKRREHLGARGRWKISRTCSDPIRKSGAGKTITKKPGVRGKRKKDLERL